MTFWQFSVSILFCLFHQGWSSTYTNPVIDSNNPDPAVLALPTGGYIAVATSDHATDPSTEDAFPIYQSEDLVNWQLQGHVFPAGSWPSWAAKNLWAPEMHLVNGRYLVYFSASAPNSRHSTGVAISQTDSPLGPFVDLGEPLIYHNEDSVVGVIDATYFKDPQTEQDYLIWKTDTLVPLSISSVFIRELNEDGVSFKNGSQASKILQSDIPSEQGIVEGMWMMYKEDNYFLFYSSSWFTLPSYHMGVARSKSIMGPYVKRDVPVVETDWERYNSGQNCTFEGPGHGSVVVDKAGDWWVVYHSWRYAHLDRQPGRVMLLDRLEWNGAPEVELWPVVWGGGVPSDTEREGPAV